MTSFVSALKCGMLTNEKLFVIYKIVKVYLVGTEFFDNLTNLTNFIKTNFFDLTIIWLNCQFYFFLLNNLLHSHFMRDGDYLHLI